MPVYGQQAEIALDGYGSFSPRLTGDRGEYTAGSHSGMLYYSNCCVGVRGNVDGDPLDQITIADLVYLVSYMFQSGPVPPCMKEANINGDIFGTIDISDLLYLVDYMFQNGPEPALCY